MTWKTCPEPRKVCGVEVWWGSNRSIRLSTCSFEAPPRTVVKILAQPESPWAIPPCPLAWKIRVVRKEDCKVVDEVPLCRPPCWQGPVEVNIVTPEREGVYHYEVEVWELCLFWWLCTARGEVTVKVSRNAPPPTPPRPPTGQPPVARYLAPVMGAVAITAGVSMCVAESEKRKRRS